MVLTLPREPETLLYLARLLGSQHLPDFDLVGLGQVAGTFKISFTEEHLNLKTTVVKAYRRK